MKGRLRLVAGGTSCVTNGGCRIRVERVWQAITEPEEIVQWLGEADLEPVEGGAVVLRWLNTPEQAVARGTVTAFDPPHVLELDTDIHGILRWELEEDGDACRLTFTASYPEKDEETRRTSWRAGTSTSTTWRTPSRAERRTGRAG